MKRGLKEAQRLALQGGKRSVTTYSPMKRGLKVKKSILMEVALSVVTTYSPMKRGLKGQILLGHFTNPSSLQPIPR